MASLHTLITFYSDENLHICLFKLWFVNLKILWAVFCYFVLLDLVTTTSHHFNDESNYYCFFLSTFVSMVSDANLIWQLVMSKHEMGCRFFGPAFVSMDPHCTHIFIDKVFFVCFFQCTARKCFSTLPTLAVSSTSSCSSPKARHYNLRSKHAKRSAKARPHFFCPNSLVCHTKRCCFFCVSILRSSYPTF